MKKITILTALLIFSYLSTNFSGCILVKYIIHAITNMSSGDYRYADSSNWFEYTIYVGDNGKIWRSTGENNLIFTEITSPVTHKLNNVRVSPHDSFDDAIAVGNNGTIIFSSNTGNTWSASTPITSSDLYGIDFIFGEVYAVGNDGVILNAPYPGGEWSLQTSNSIRNLKAVKVSSQLSGRIIAVGEKGTILRSTDSGVTWLNVSLTDTTINFNDISQKGIYFSGEITCAVGSGGTIFKTTDYGATWQQKTSGTTNDLRKIYFNSPDSGVVVGDNGTIRLTTNGGESWFQDAFFNSPSGRNFRSVSLINREHNTFSALSDSLFFVSADPLIVGVETVGSAIPNKYSLSQNYPNPFNPTTKIEFSLTKQSVARLVVYDLTGKEIEILINKTLTPGTYEADFDGSKYSSGIYFYRLTTGDFSETKKMILTK